MATSLIPPIVLNYDAIVTQINDNGYDIAKIMMKISDNADTDVVVVAGGGGDDDDDYDDDDDNDNDDDDDDGGGDDLEELILARMPSTKWDAICA